MRLDDAAEAREEAGRAWIYPMGFFEAARRGGAAVYLGDEATRALVDFFEKKGLAQLKAEDRREEWYGDWIAYQKEHGIYTGMLSPAGHSSKGGRFDLLRYARFLEVFAYCSPAHGYSVHVTFLGLYSILMGTNEALKKEAVEMVEAGKLLGFGVSEKAHGSDLLANEFCIGKTAGGGMIANGTKYYIGNADVAAMIAVLGRKEVEAGEKASRAPFMMIAVRPERSAGWRSLGKIRTLGVRAANVGAFELKDHAVAEGDVIAEGREAWDAVFGTVTLGKFLLGFGSIGICERAWEEAAAHLRSRVLYGKPVIAMPHIEALAAEAYVRLTAMKLYGYRALDYVQGASATDRRYQLFCAVQKARVSTEGMKVMGLLGECMGAKGFESGTYFEMALRDAQLIPSLEGSMHINLLQAGQFMGQYFERCDGSVAEMPSVVGGEAEGGENAYLTEARAGGMRNIRFGPFLEAYRALRGVANVALFARQAAAFRRVIQREEARNTDAADTQMGVLLGQCLATIVYGQLVAEGAVQLKVPMEMVSAMFGILVGDMSRWALQLAGLGRFDEAGRGAVMKMVRVGRTSAEEWEAVTRRCQSAEV